MSLLLLNISEGPGGDDPFGDGGDDDWDDEEDDGWGDEEDDSWDSDSTDTDVDSSEEVDSAENKDAYKVPKDSKWEKQVKPKAEFKDCKCNWGLFRDRNITMRKPVRFYTGQKDLDLKGVVTRYNGKKELNWWKPGSVCDEVKGQDASTLPPGLNESDSFEVFIALMCRTLKMNFEKVRTLGDNF